MQWIAALAALVPIFAPSAPVLAQPTIDHRAVITTSWVEEWDAAERRWIRIEETVEAARATSSARAHQAYHSGYATRANRFTPRPQRAAAQGSFAQYGPFVVMDETRAAIIGSTDSASPHHFDAMIRDFPALRTLEMIEAPGTNNDIANLAVGRKIRAHGLSTHVPHGGSVRSGAVELFLAGVHQTIDPGAQFAVHSWLDNYGREPDDFAPDDPANRLYLDYYLEMGMSAARARDFYAMTNSVPHHSAKWLQADEMRRWITPEDQRQPAYDRGASFFAIRLIEGFEARHHAPLLVYGDLSGVTVANLSLAFTQPFLDS